MSRPISKQMPANATHLHSSSARVAIVKQCVDISRREIDESFRFVAHSNSRMGLWNEACRPGARSGSELRYRCCSSSLPWKERRVRVWFDAAADVCDRFSFEVFNARHGAAS